MDKTLKELISNKVNQVVAYQDRQNAIDLDLDPDECKESHLSGDCPLCGAS